MARPKRVEGVEGAARPVGILAQLPSVPALEKRLAELQAESARVERLVECLRAMEGPEIVELL
jgi:hypothetical protein